MPYLDIRPDVQFSRIRPSPWLPHYMEWGFIRGTYNRSLYSDCSYILCLPHRLNPMNLQTLHFFFGFAFPSNAQAVLIYDSLLFSSHEPDPFTSAKCYPSLLLPAAHWLGFIVTMSQLTPHITSVLDFPLNGLYHFSTYNHSIGVYEVSLGKTIYLHHMPTLIHHTFRIHYFPYFYYAHCTGFP
jgi:hypothetical protein